MTEIPQSDQPTKKQFRSSTLWIGLSFVLSTAILVWSFTLPFRQKDPLFDSKKDADGEVLDATEIKHRQQMQANEFRDAALALDAELMQAVREKSRTEEKPDIRHARQKWNRHVESVHRQLKSIGKVERGTLEWRYQQELLKSLEDAPE